VPSDDHGDSLTSSVQLASAYRADVFWFGPKLTERHMPLLRGLDGAGLQVVGDFTCPDLPPSQWERIVRGCTGVVAVVTHDAIAAERASVLAERLRCVSDLGLPLLLVADDLNLLRASPTHVSLSDGSRVDIHSERRFGPCVILDGPGYQLDIGCQTAKFAKTAARIKAVQPPYAFFIGRLERDFLHAREALRLAVRSELGIECLWSDDGTRRVAIDSVRATTQELIRGATFIIADLTLGPENPRHENPSRAHEIGLASAYGKTLMLCSREPRRYPYFSIGDLQMFFWTDEQDLFDRASAWLRSNRDALGRKVLNETLAQWDPAHERYATLPPFQFDPERAYCWRGDRPFSDCEVWATAASAAALMFALPYLAGVPVQVGGVLLALAALAAAAVFWWMGRAAWHAHGLWRPWSRALPHWVLIGSGLVAVLAAIRAY
jgi:hypothetical protein